MPLAIDKFIEVRADINLRDRRFELRYQPFHLARRKILIKWLNRGTSFLPKPLDEMSTICPLRPFVKLLFSSIATFANALGRNHWRTGVSLQTTIFESIKKEDLLN